MKVAALLFRPHHRGAATGAVSKTRPRTLWRQLLAHNAARLGLAIALLLALIVLVGPLLVTQDPNAPDYGAKLAAPSAAHLLGADQAGRDQLARLVDGGTRSLGAALLVLGCVFVIGLFVGMVAGMAGGMIDVVIMRVVDLLMAFPGMVLAIAVVGTLGPGFQNLLLALIIAWWAYYARLTRSLVLTARQRPDVIAARLAGIGWSRIVWGHIAPGVVMQLMVVATLDLGGMIAAISGLSFLGLGVQPPLAEWGAMLSDARFYFTIAPWLLLGPATLIFLSVVAANLIGNALRDSLDPGRIQ